MPYCYSLQTNPLFSLVSFHCTNNFYLKNLLVNLFVLLLLIFSMQSRAGKAECQPYLDKLHHIQSLQRAGYSAQQGERLKRREDKARDKWWQCSRGKLKTKAGDKSKKTSYKKGKNKQAKYKSSYRYSKQQQKKANRAYATNTLVVKQKYQGEQLQRWHRFYQKPKKCQRPKTMQQFSYCVEDKNRQQLAFEQSESSRK